MFVWLRTTDHSQGRNSVSTVGGRRPPLSQDLEAGGRNIFFRMDLSLKYSQKRNFFQFFEQKRQNFQKQGVDAPHAPLVFTPLIILCNHLSSMRFDFVVLQCLYNFL